MKPEIKNVCFVIDSPMNAMMASLIARDAPQVEVIYVFDPERKDVDEYLRVSRGLLSSLKLASERVIEFNSARFWGGEKNHLLPAARKALAPLIKQHPRGTVYFGNCLTNPVALALKRYAKVNHLYHAPGDFVSMLFPQGSLLKPALKNLAKRILGLELYKIEIGNFPVYSLLNFASQKNFEYLNFNDFSSKEVEAILAELGRELDVPGKNIMLLLAGDEPEPGDKNPSNITKYLKPHYQAVETLMKADGLDSATLWVKEHKSYFPLTSEERSMLIGEFSRLGCAVRFIADHVPKAYRSLPGECILKYGKVDYVVAEPSAFLFNVAGSAVVPVAAVTAFAPYRDQDQQGRNAEFMAINARLVVPCRVY
jgi:hypothetical protein